MSDEKKSFSDRREFPRYNIYPPIFVNVLCVHSGKKHQAELTNLSESGMSIRSLEDIDFDQPITIYFNFNAEVSEPAKIALKTKCAWSGEDDVTKMKQYGVSFLTISETAIIMIIIKQFGEKDLS